MYHSLLYHLQFHPLNYVTTPPKKSHLHINPLVAGTLRPPAAIISGAAQILLGAIQVLQEVDKPPYLYMYTENKRFWSLLITNMKLSEKRF